MTGKQFKFSIVVGGALIALGVVIVPQASVGFSLLALGLGLTGLSIINFRSALQKRAAVPLAGPSTPTPVRTVAKAAQAG